MNDNMPEHVDLTFSKVDDTFLDRLAQYIDQMKDQRERYILNWTGRGGGSFAEAGKPLDPAKTLRPDVQNSVNFDTTRNLFITGDNLEALKLLQESYLGKVDMIYIDPPYNTGKDFVYHDNFTTSTTEQIDETRDDDGNRQFSVNTKENGRYHSDWLSMMYPRLILARNFLSDKGVIFISIDDNEQANLKLLCDSVFGEDNFINQFMWLHGKGKKDSWSRTAQQYIVAYARNKSMLKPWSDVQLSQGSFSNPDNDPRGDWFSGSISFSEERSNKERDTYFTIESPSGVKWTRQWQVANKAEMNSLLKDNRIYFGPAPNYSNVPRRKIFPFDENEIIPSNILDNVGTTRGAQKDLGALLKGNVFDNPKPHALIEKLIAISNLSDSSTILDFFAGSGTTAQAVMQQNAKDGGYRQFILVQLPEQCNEKSEAYKAGYKTIDELSRERIRRAAKKIAAEDEHADQHDYGFRAMYIDYANENDGIERTASQTNQTDILNMANNIRNGRTPLDLLFGVLLQKGWNMDGQLTRLDINGNEVLAYDHIDGAPGTGVVACFDHDINPDTVQQIIDMAPQAAVFRDSSFKSSSDKINLVERFRTANSGGVTTGVWVI